MRFSAVIYYLKNVVEYKTDLGFRWNASGGSKAHPPPSEHCSFGQ